ncbi:MAG: hypothetical protein HY716_16030 [Planctomycetes bacterium]|nr:hypothetical protein [Planctomycetota bacterium]
MNVASPGRLRVVLLLAAAILLPSCGRDSEDASLPPVPDFALLDVNPNSARFDEAVSPRDYMGLVPAWYFGHAT